MIRGRWVTSLAQWNSQSSIQIYKLSQSWLFIFVHWNLAEWILLILLSTCSSSCPTFIFICIQLKSVCLTFLSQLIPKLAWQDNEIQLWDVILTVSIFQFTGGTWRNEPNTCCLEFQSHSACCNCSQLPSQEFLAGQNRRNLSKEKPVVIFSYIMSGHIKWGKAGLRISMEFNMNSWMHADYQGDYFELLKYFNQQLVCIVS